MKVSLIVSTYNRPEALRVCLNSIKKQSQLPFEVVIGDDGSRKDTKDLIDQMKKDFPVPIVHVWHEDEGFRLAMMRNKAVAASSGDYIIEIDGDVFLHKHFVKDHMKYAAPGYYLKGGRVNLNQETTDRIILKGKPEYPLFKGVESKPENGFYLPLVSSYLLERYRRLKSPGLGCNMSFWKKDYIAVNGYDEYFVGWGGEDIEFGMRMQSYGLGKRYLKFSGIVYHLWHEDKYMQNKDGNFGYADTKMSGKSTWCENGIDKYLKKD